MASQRYQINKNKYLLNPEYDRLIYILESYIEKDTRNCTLLFLAVFTGARAQELLNIQHQDINEYDETLFIKGIKGSNDRELPIAPWLFKKVLQSKKISMLSPKNSDLKPGSKFLFPISYPRLVQIWELYRPVHKKFHSLRHTFAIRLYHKTKDIRLLQVALGHRNITNTMVYADYAYSQNELKKLIL